MLTKYFRSLYERTMREAYNVAFREIVVSLQEGGKCLDCGCNNGSYYERLNGIMPISKTDYYGIEWAEDLVAAAVNNEHNVIQGDLNADLPFEDHTFQCVYGLSVLEHLLRGCHWMKESKRVLEPDGSLVILTPNISTFFTMALLAVGKMPSSGPHPDSELLLQREALMQVSQISEPDVESDTPLHRHLVVFSFRVLRHYLKLIGFSDVKGYGFGLYPLPNFMQPVLEKIDPYHCHQMVMIAKK